MTPFEQALLHFESRPAAADPQEEARRQGLLDHFSAINRFERIIPSPLDMRLFRLLAQ